MPPAPNNLTEPEQRLPDAIHAGTLVDLRTGTPEKDDPATGEQWGPERSIRAQLLYDLLTDPDSTRPRPRALRLRGARITGTLDLEATTLLCPLTLHDCYLDRPFILVEAQAAAIRLPGTHINPPPGMPAFNAEQLETRGNLDLNDAFTAIGETRLLGAHIGGNLDFQGATLTNPNGHALTADGLTVDQDMFCRLRFTAIGETRLPGAHIGGNLDFQGATLTNPNGHALTADGLTVDQAMFCHQGFKATGEIRLLGAHIGGQLAFAGATLTNPEGIALNADRLSVNHSMFCHQGFKATGEIRLPGAHISGQLTFTGATLTNPEGRALTGHGLTVEQTMLCGQGFKATGEICLPGAHISGQLDFTGATLTNSGKLALDLERMAVTALCLRTATPPDSTINLAHAHVGILHDSEATWPKGLDLGGFTYDTLDARPPVDARARLRWLELHPGGYTPQPYEQLIAAYRRAGNDQAARAVAIAKQRRRRIELNRPGKLWNTLLAWTVGYGYRTWQALLWLAGFLAAGWIVFAAAYPSHMTPAKQPPTPAFHPGVYALDVLLPVVDLHQQDYWIPRGLAQWWTWVSILAGWVLTTAVVAALTGILKKD